MHWAMKATCMVWGMKKHAMACINERITSFLSEGNFLKETELYALSTGDRGIVREAYPVAHGATYVLNFKLNLWIMALFRNALRNQTECSGTRLYVVYE
jgi:hypothetical protein